jgi:hypothetical protein
LHPLLYTVGGHAEFFKTILLTNSSHTLWVVVKPSPMILYGARFRLEYCECICGE